MGSSLKKDRIVVFGGTGSIGSAVCLALLKAGYNIDVISRGNRPGVLFQIVEKKDPHLLENGVVREQVMDVTVGGEMNLTFGWPHNGSFKGIVYAVGDCPPGGFDQTVEKPLNEIHFHRFADELNRHVVGLFNAYQRFHRAIKNNGHIVVIGSAITRLNDVNCPPWLHAGHYATAKAAQQELVNWLRRDPYIKEKKILVHRLAPAAVDTPFHEGCKHQPPAKVSVNDVAKRVCDAFGSKAVIDEMMATR